MPEANKQSTVDIEDAMITIAWTETTHYQTRITMSEAHELLINEYRDDLRLTRTAEEIVQLLGELDLDDHLTNHRNEAWHDHPDQEIQWIKPQKPA